eukprot:gnl/TRDRNA2_/TRDRNA2_164100_c0_seq1.p1 gnl/TRDRNA2_/TRDRNA2_164100_c0~~gnl/TRDRNA2_/TRDRNA2_164100_c0_seq1.p1  ORF type:complete len:205 (-),score=21.30 gnl/TRDRNA2_/TRDRNA2_164100_c0_seq1:191-805(-)
MDHKDVHHANQAFNPIAIDTLSGTYLAFQSETHVFATRIYDLSTLQLLQIGKREKYEFAVVMKGSWRMCEYDYWNEENLDSAILARLLLIEGKMAYHTDKEALMPFPLDLAVQFAIALKPTLAPQDLLDFMLGELGMTYASQFQQLQILYEATHTGATNRKACVKMLALALLAKIQVEAPRMEALRSELHSMILVLVGSGLSDE